MNPLKSLKLSNVYKRICGVNSPRSFVGKIKPFIEENTRQAVEEWKIAREKMKDIPGTNYNLGLLHLKNGNLDDAILRFKMVIFLAPERADAYYHLARCLLMVGDDLGAEEYINKAIALKGDFPEASYIITKIQNPDTIDAIPANIIASHFEGDSNEKPESQLQKDKGLVNMSLINVTDKNPNLNVLDLGCGNGGRGLILSEKEVLRKITGVDLSPKAINKAKSAKFNGEIVYSNVIEADISVFMANNQDKYDLILAGDVFSYCKQLDNIFSNIVRSLNNGGIIAFKVNKEYIENRNIEEITAYHLDISKDKFIHTVEYFEEILRKTGFMIEEKREKEIEGVKFDIIVAKV